MTITWGGYPRISDDPYDQKAGVGRQREDITAGVVARGGDPEAIRWYEENDTSAFKQRKIRVTDPLGNTYDGYRVIRPMWHRALNDLRTGVIDALMVWDLDRLARDPRDLEDGIEAVVYYNARIEASTPGKVNLRDDEGIAMARVMVAMGNKSSADTSRRVRRMHLDLAAKGRPVGGRRTFGWKADKLTLDPQEAGLARQAVEDVLNGVTLSAIVKRWNSAGVRTVMGNDWSTQVLRQYLVNPRLAGVRTLRGEVVNAEAAWTPLISRDDFDRLCGTLVKAEARSRVPRRDARHYMLTGIIRCGICNGPMYGNPTAQGGFNYTCNASRPSPHGVAVKGTDADDLIASLFLARMSNESLGQQPASGMWSREAELVEVRGQIEALMAAMRDKRMTAERAIAAVGELERDEAELQQDRTRWLAETTGPALDRITPDEWATLTAPERNARLEKVFSAVMVLPSGRGRRFSPERLVPVWRQDQPAPAAGQE